MSGPIQPEVNGEFYIDDVNDNFWLRENSAWTKKGKLVRAHLVGLTSEGAFPFTNAQAFELALSETPEHYYPAFSTARSEVNAIFPTAASCDVVLTNDLASFLGAGSNVICTAHFEGVAQRATLTFADVIIPPFVPLWVVMPLTADATLAGLRCLFASEPT
jgi:hypothetical protein